MTVYGKKRWRRRLERSLRVHTRYWVLIAVGLTLFVGAGTALAAIVLRGRGTLVAPALDEQQLVVNDERLSAPLVPGGSSDLLFEVRNPNAFPARVDRVSLGSALRAAKPAGCTAKVSGPVTKPGGYALPAAERVTVPAGGRLEVTVAGAFKLAASAARGCGFTVDILVNATQGVSPTSAPPAVTAPPEPPVTTPPSTTRPADPTTAPPPTTDLPDEDPGDGGNPPAPGV